jgi:hypothetical protein
MSVLLSVVGAIAVMLGVAMVGYGIPINAFSFGNTLIIAGTTAVVGGLIVIGVAAAVAQLQRISEALANRPPVRPSRPLETFDPVQAPPPGAPGRNPFPPRQKSDALAREAYAHEQRMPPAMPADLPHYDERSAASAPPFLRNPELAPAEDYAEVSLSPRHADLGEFTRPASPPTYNGNGAAMPRRHEGTGAEPAGHLQPPPPQAPPRRAQPPSQFDNMWPAEPKSPATSTLASEARLDSRPAMTAPPPPPSPREQISREQAPSEQALREQVVSEQALRENAPKAPGAVAILKSGVVDGMGYTLYVDGSIEAELPQGTLRFASINDLRNHLAKSP